MFIIDENAFIKMHPGIKKIEFKTDSTRVQNGFKTCSKHENLQFKITI